MKKSLSVISIALLVCFAVGCQKQTEEAVTEKTTEPTKIIDNAISSDGVSLAYEVRGDGDPVLVFVHGWSNNRSVWENQLAHFSSKYKVVAIDLAGFGDSGNARDDWTMEAFGYDVSSVLDKLRLENAILVGFSMGVPVVIETAEIRPGKVSGIVLVDFLQNIETVYSDEDISNSDRALMELVTEPSVEKSEPFFVKNKTELAKRYVSLIKDASRIGWRESLKNIWLWCNYECADSLKNVQSQVVSINADQNPTNEEAFRKYVPSFRAKIIEGIGHFVPWEAPDEFNRLLEESIRELVETTKNQQL